MHDFVIQSKRKGVISSKFSAENGSTYYTDTVQNLQQNQIVYLENFQLKVDYDDFPF